MGLLSVLDLWRHVVRRASDCLQLLPRLLSLRQAKVNQLQLILIREHNVLRLHISVDDSLRVHVAERSEELLAIPSCDLLGKHLITLGGNFVEELAPSDVLHDQIYVLFIDISLIVLYDIGMVQLCENVHLLLDGVQMILQFLFIQHLDGYLVLRVRDVVS